MSLVKQRNRFLSFAFAAADILIETDLNGRVSYAAGAVAALGEPLLNGAGEDLAKRPSHSWRAIGSCWWRWHPGSSCTQSGGTCEPEL